MFTIREATPTDLAFLWEMLWQAAAVDEGMRGFGKEGALARPENQKYLAGWGHPGDAGVIAISESGDPLGGAWYRLFEAHAPGYGFVAPDVPELSIGVSEKARGHGVGSALLEALVSLARQQGFRRISLSVDRQNPAVRLYERQGFRDAGISNPADTSLTMVRDL
jgi:ribosomal protein S18 acetylase RimI-like enzyme